MTHVISSKARNLGHLKIYSEARNDQYHYYWRTTQIYSTLQTSKIGKNIGLSAANNVVILIIIMK